MLKFKIYGLIRIETFKNNFQVMVWMNKVTITKCNVISEYN